MSALPPKADIGRLGTSTPNWAVTCNRSRNLTLSAFAICFRSWGWALLREHDKIGLDSGLIAQGIVRDDKCGTYRQQSGNAVDGRLRYFYAIERGRRRRSCRQFGDELNHLLLFRLRQFRVALAVAVARACIAARDRDRGPSHGCTVFLDLHGGEDVGAERQVGFGNRHRRLK